MVILSQSDIMISSTTSELLIFVAIIICIISLFLCVTFDKIGIVIIGIIISVSLIIMSLCIPLVDTGIDEYQVYVNSDDTQAIEEIIQNYDIESIRDNIWIITNKED